MATGALDANGIWQYGEDDSETTASALLNKLGESTSEQVGILQTNLKVINVYSAKATTTQSATLAANTFNDFTGASITLTPQSSGSKFLILSSAYIANSQATFRSLNSVRCLRGATTLYTVTNEYTSSDSTRGLYTISSQHLDSPSTTSSITYKMQGAHSVGGATPTVYFNRSQDNTSIGYTSITILEIQG
jgi:hypothetical protein